MVDTVKTLEKWKKLFDEWNGRIPSELLTDEEWDLIDRLVSEEE